MTLTESEAREMGVPIGRDLIGMASTWELHRCEEWRCREIRELTGLGSPAYGSSSQARTLVPPTYLVAQYVDTVAMGVPDAPIRFNGGNDCRWLRPVYVDDVLERSTGVVDVVVRAGSQGVLVIYTLETTFRVADSGDTVARCGLTAIRQYRPEGLGGSRGGDGAGPRKDGDGEELPDELACEVCPTSRDLVRYAAATGDLYEAHYDQAYALEKGLPGVIVHGMLKLGWFAAAAAAVRDDGYVTEIGASYRRIDLVGAPVQVRQRPAGDGVDGREALVLRVRQENGRTSTFGHAVVVTGGRAEDAFSAGQA